MSMPIASGALRRADPAATPIHAPRRAVARLARAARPAPAAAWRAVVAACRRWPEWAAPAAALWSAVYGTLGLHWTRGGAGFPFGAGHDPAPHLSALGGARASSAAPLVALLGFAGAALAMVLARASGRGAGRAMRLAAAWSAAAGLALVVPDARLLAVTAYLPIIALATPFGWSPDTPLAGVVGWPLLNQLVCAAGGMLWAGAALAHQRRTRGACVRCGRADRTARWATPAAARRWGAWAVAVAMAVPLVYAASRWAWVFGFSFGAPDAPRAIAAAGPLGAVAPFGLGAVAVAGAVLTLGLARPWGETFPRWLPRVGGRRVPPRLATVPAALATVLATSAGLTIVRAALAGAVTLDGDWSALAPGLLWPAWGAALGAATLAYHLRRRGRCAACGRA